MKKFILGIIVTLVVIGVVAYIVSQFGFMNMRADQKPSGFETHFASRAMDASVERHAPALKNPVEPTEANLREGMIIYTMNCAVCHGTGKAPSTLHEYPPAPQFVDDPADMPENQNYYIIQHGVRLTAMPGWSKTLNQDQTWKVVTFLAHMQKLPPALEADWSGAPAAENQNAAPAAPQAAKPKSHHHQD